MSLPPAGPLASLLTAPSGPQREEAWKEFIAAYSDLLLFVARRLGGGDDAMMDRYAFVIEGLRRDDFRKLRGYQGIGPGPFSTWLIVVARRLCLDHHRRRYGRPQSDKPGRLEERQTRRRLIDLVGNELALDEVPSHDSATGVDGMARAETLSALAQALDALPAEERLLLRLRFEDGVSVPKLARSLGIDSPFVVYRQIDAILRGLRSRLEASGIDDGRT